jgi:hypothetical protein
MSFVEEKLIERIRMECSAHTLKGFHANMVLHLFIDKLHAKFLKRRLNRTKTIFQTNLCGPLTL